ncbi:GNAT family N-acetyltransferase [uncultured Pseudokineococcus sp.]|uniref:GNAT family N-acetyltransferase n=1 Tax=uncultured Pseudokineococcus sp. TaxID=1642928 RepID=UPI0026103E9F|nr:GNAT family N-acetyltransferase [uncultured Pseudokineococcus sp.]
MADPLRDAPSDARQIAEVHVARWRAAYRHLVPQALLDVLSADDREERWREAAAHRSGVLVHDAAAGRVDGSCAFGPCSDEDAADAVGAVHPLSVLPSAWGAGLRRRLLDAALSHLRAGAGTGAGAPVLRTLEGDARARGLSERQGWRPDGRRRTQRRPGIGAVPENAVDEVRYRLPG